MIISRGILRMRHISEKKVVEKIRTHLIFNNFFPEIVQFM